MAIVGQRANWKHHQYAESQRESLHGKPPL